MNDLDQILDQYEEKLGLPPYSSFKANNFDHFNYSRSQLEKLSVEDCSIASYDLSQCAFHIQRSLNRELAKKNWAVNALKNYVADKAQEYTGPWDRQERQVIKHDEYALKLDRIVEQAQLRIDRLRFLTNNIRNMSIALINIQKAKSDKK